MNINFVFSFLGLLGGLLCAGADMLLDLKGRDNKKIGKLGIVDSKWASMSEWRFKASILLVMIAVPLYALGLWSLSEQIGGTVGFLLKPFTFVGSMGGFFIHAFLCLMPILYQNHTDKDQAISLIEKLYKSIQFPFLFLYLVLVLGTTVLVEIAIFNGSLNVPWFCVFLNPLVFMIIGVSLRFVKYDWFCDLPGICMPSLGLGMFGLLGMIHSFTLYSM